MAKTPLLVLGLLGLLLTQTYAPILQRLRVLGLLRTFSPTPNIHGTSMRLVPNTVACEDLHLHHESQLLFTACQDDLEARLAWFPPLERFEGVAIVNQGSLRVVDPTTFTSTRLTLTGFTCPFITHGIDVITDPNDAAAVFIFAINHLPDPNYNTSGPRNSLNQTRSQIELFRHVLGTTTATHVRSVLSPDIYTPNDIHATSPTTFYVTNDHHYRTGPKRAFEEVMTSYLAGWSTTIHVTLTSLTPSNPSSDLITTTALDTLHNNNGLAASSPHRPDELLIGDASGGVLTRARKNLDPTASKHLHVLEHIQLDSCIDNPSYYYDPYATPTNNASGYVLAGLAKAYALAGDAFQAEKPVPMLVWHIRTAGEVEGKQGHLEKTIIFQDDGVEMRSASSAILIGIDPKENGGSKQAWLFVTGFLSKGMVATKIDL